MKHKFLYFLIAFSGLALIFTSCKKDRGPRLIVHVQEEDGTPAVSAYVHAWYGDNTGQPGSVLNDSEMNQRTSTDAAGDAIFDFKYSAVLDVEATYYKQYPDSLIPTIMHTDTLRGRQVVKIEQLRQRSKENNYNITIDVD